MRRARNKISRNREWSLFAADLYDDGPGSAQEVADKLTAAFGEKFTARTVGSWYKVDYAPVEAMRLKRRESADRVEMIFAAAEENGMTFVDASQDLLARMIYDLLEAATGPEGLEAKDIAGLGRSIAKMQSLDLQSAKLEFEKAKFSQAEAIKSRIGDLESLSGDDAEAAKKMVDDLMLGGAR